MHNAPQLYNRIRCDGGSTRILQKIHEIKLLVGIVAVNVTVEEMTANRGSAIVYIRTCFAGRGGTGQERL